MEMRHVGGYDFALLRDNSVVSKIYREGRDTTVGGCIRRSYILRVLVADDHELVRRGICSVLSTDPSITLCGEAIDGQDAVEKACSLLPNIVVMDISMPRLNGLDATREIKRQIPQTQVIIVSQHNASELMRQAIGAGALGYVVKSSIASDLLGAISNVSKGEMFVRGDTGVNPHPDPDIQEILKRSAAFELALRESEERFRSAMNHMAEGLYILDTSGRVTYVNASAEEMFGWSAAELMGKKIHDLTHYKRPDGTHFPASDCPGLQVVEKGIELREHEDCFIRKDGSFLPVIFSASPMRIGGKIVGIVVGFRDDTKRREAEIALESRIAERTDELLKTRNELRGLSARLLNTQDEERRRIARELHDGVGQLLAAMNMNNSTILSEKSKLTQDALKSLDENRSLVDQALRDIRTMSYLLHPPLLDEIGLGSALRWYLDGFAERSKIAVSLDIADNMGKLPREVELSLFRIVQECLTNIHRHSESPTARISLHRTADEVILEVRDEGKGIPPDIQVKVVSGEGYGLGMRGIRERLRQFDGRLQIQSSGSGTVVIATLPDTTKEVPGKNNSLSDAEEPRAETPPPASPLPTKDETATILCIDDEPAGMFARKLLLESAGHRVVEARSGLEGIRLFKSLKIDAVVLDYWMSGMKGTAVATEIKGINPGVPIIVLSGLPEFPGEATGVIDEWLLKGNHRAEHLLETVKALLERRAV